MGKIKTKDGTEIFYKDRGSGQPIVFSHGWPLSAQGLRMKDAGEDLLHGSVIPCGHFATPLAAGF